MFTRRCVMTAMLLALPLLTSSTASAQDFGTDAVVQGVGACPSFELAPRLGITATAGTAPGLWEALTTSPHRTIYESLARRLWPNMPTLTARAAAVRDQPTYQALLALANSIAIGAGATGRVVITVADGTVMIDTSRNDGPGSPTNNLYQNFLNKTINENHNSRVAIFIAQLYPCGIGVESKRSTSTGRFENYVAIRLGNHLDNAGTVRLSIAP